MPQKYENTKTQKHNGFTLLEMVVAVAIFIVIALLVTDIFLIAAKSHRRTMEVQKILSDSRFAMETMVRETRMAEIDYDYYYTYNDGLPLIDINNQLIVFRQEDSDVCPDSESQPCLAVGRDINGSGDIETDEWASITPAGVALVNLYFYIFPDTEDPFYFYQSAWQYFSNSQPMVTILLAVRSVNPPQGQIAPEVIYLQTTAVTRVYKR